MLGRGRKLEEDGDDLFPLVEELGVDTVDVMPRQSGLRGNLRGAGDAGASRLAAAAALIGSAGPGLNRFASAMAGFKASVNSNLSGYGAPGLTGCGGGMGFMTRMAAIDVVRSFIDSVQISLVRAKNEIHYLQYQAIRKTADTVFSSQQGFGDFIDHNPISNTVIGTGEVIAGVAYAIGSLGLGMDVGVPTAIDGGNRLVKGFYKIFVGDWTGEETDSWWPI